jgi:hypothetical protein
MIKKNQSDTQRHNSIAEIYEELESIVTEYDLKIKVLLEALEKNTENTHTNDNKFLDIVNNMLGERVRLEEEMLLTRINLIKNIKKDELIKILKQIGKDQE